MGKESKDCSKNARQCEWHRRSEEGSRKKERPSSLHSSLRTEEAVQICARAKPEIGMHLQMDVLTRRRDLLKNRVYAMTRNKKGRKSEQKDGLGRGMETCMNKTRMMGDINDVVI